MTLVRIIKDWDWPDLMRQTPGCKGIWGGIQFTLEPVKNCDYVIVLNRAAEDTTVYCPPQHIWAVMQEPPNEYFGPMHRGDKSYDRIYTSDIGLHGERYLYSQPALPWHVNKDYDFLARCGVLKKEHPLSWITSNIAAFQGHHDRLRFLERIRDKLEFDLYGRGFSYIKDKWDGLASYRYSLVVENFRNSYYWSEKIADCFLAWTMPIYYGCTRISEYFPSDAIVCIDINDPLAIEKIQETVSSDLWHRRLAAIAQARKLVLDRYQLFPFVVKEIRSHERNGCPETHRPKLVTVPHQLRPPQTIGERMRKIVQNSVPRHSNQVIAKLWHIIKR